MSVDELRGDKVAGFRFETIGHAVVLAGWGFWTDELAQELGDLAADAVSVLPSGGTLVLNFEGLHPQRPAGEDAIAVVLGMAKRRRAHIATVIPNAITRLQMRRVAAAAAVELRVVATLDEALTPRT